MNKKLIVFCSILAVILLATIGYVFYHLFESSSSEIIPVNDSRIDALHAIPADASLVYDFNTFSDAESFLFDPSSHFSFFSNPKSALRSFFKLIPDQASDWGTVFSLHYSSKNKVSILFVLSLPKSSDKEKFSADLVKECAGVINKKYDGVTIYKSSVPDISFTVYNNFLIASTSIGIVESSVRHLAGRTSILDNSQFAQMSKYVQGKASLHVNNMNIGKLFSGTVERRFLGYADFASAFSSWMMMNTAVSAQSCEGEGRLLNSKDEGNFSSIFALQKSQESEVFDILPYNTIYAVSIPIYSDKEYINSYKSYMEARKKGNNYNYLNAMANKNGGQNISTSEWFLSLGVKEVAAAAIPCDKGEEKVVLMRVKDLSKLKNFSKEVNPFLFKKYLSSLIGDFFTPSDEGFYSVVSDWVIIGSRQMAESISSENGNQLFFSFAEYLNQTPAAKVCKGNSSLTAVVNLSRCKDSLKAVVKDEYSKYIIGGIDNTNFNLLSFRLLNEGGKVKFTFGAYSDNLSELPKPPSAEIISNSSAVVADDTPIEVPKGPFAVKNFLNGKNNYLKQNANNKLSLLDDKKNGVWTVPFDKPLCGYVRQIDILKNDKLQMMFCAGSKLYLMDRLGRWVKPFPIDLKREVALGPEVYDFGNNKNYSMMVLHSDNTAILYDINGKPVNGWNTITAPEKIKALPELLKAGEKRYWVVRTSYQTLIFNSNGSIIADFTKKRKLKADTKITPQSSKEVAVTTAEGKDMILNLETGVFRKL